MSVRRPTNGLSDGERELGEPELQRAMSTRRCLMIRFFPSEVSWVVRCCQVPIIAGQRLGQTPFQSHRSLRSNAQR